VALTGRRPAWVTFDCYGTLIQWDEGLLAAVRQILARHGASGVDPGAVLRAYDQEEYRLEQTPPHRLFREIAGESLRLALAQLGLASDRADIELLTSSISRMPPFPEVPGALGALKAAGLHLCIVSNTDDDIIAGNVAQLGGHVERVVTAQQARAYKPSRRIFEHAHRLLGVGPDDVVHVCASPQIDLTAARDIGFRSVWIDRGTGRAPLPDYVPAAVLPTLEGVPRLFREAGWM
jgi:2-haloacid dehalogenase